MYREDADVVFVIWADDGNVLYPPPDYAADDDADFAPQPCADGNGVANGVAIGDDPATMRVQ